MGIYIQVGILVIIIIELSIFIGVIPEVRARFVLLAGKDADKLVWGHCAQCSHRFVCEW